MGPGIEVKCRTASRAVYRDPLTSFTVAAAAVLACAFAVVMPPLQLNDEHGHFVRAYQISRGDWRGDPAPALPQPVIDFLMRYPEGIDRERKLAPSEIASAFSRPPEAGSTSQSRVRADARHRFIDWSILASSLYCPIVYLPSAAGIAVARAFGFSPAAMLYAARIFNALFFAAALWAAFRLMPGSRALLAAIALMPMTLHQAGGTSADLVTIAVAFVGFALILRSRADGSDPWLLIAIAFVFPIWVLCKTSIWALPLLLLIPRRRFGSRWQRAGVVAGVALAAMAGLAIWQHVAQGNMQLFRADRLARGMDTSANVAFILAHPLRFAGMVLDYMGAHFGEHTAQFVGAFGWTKLMLSMGPRIVYLGLIFLAAIFDAPGRRISGWERAAFAALFVATMVAAYVTLFVIDGVLAPPGDNARVFTFPYTAGVQGRYFIPFCLAGFLALGQNRYRMDARRVMAVVVYGAVAFDALSLAVIWNHYYL